MTAVGRNGGLIVAMDDIVQELAVRLDTRHRILQIGLQGHDIFLLFEWLIKAEWQSLMHKNMQAITSGNNPIEHLRLRASSTILHPEQVVHGFQLGCNLPSVPPAKSRDENCRVNRASCSNKPRPPRSVMANQLALTGMPAIPTF